MHHDFFHRFVAFGANKLYATSLKEIRECDHAYRIAGLPGCIGSTDATHIPLEKVSFRIQQSDLGFKIAASRWMYNLTVNHKREILHTATFWPPWKVERQDPNLLCRILVSICFVAKGCSTVVFRYFVVIHSSHQRGSSHKTCTPSAEGSVHFSFALPNNNDFIIVVVEDSTTGISPQRLQARKPLKKYPGGIVSLTVCSS